MFIKNGQLKSKGQQLFKIVDVGTYKSGKLLMNLNVTDKEILGRIKSDLYRLVDGHFYFAN